jgi:hypothetical protein
MNVPRSTWGAVLGASIVAVSTTGCNSILDNQPGILATEDPTEPGQADGGVQLPPISGNDDGGPTGVPDASNGGTDSGTADAGGCPDGQFRCNGACVSTNDPLYGCGSASCAPCVIPHATATCQAGACVIATCDVGRSDCNAQPADGCEADLSTPTTCGACGAVCAAAAPVCAPTGPGWACSTGCGPTAPLLCGAECVDPATSVNHCGGCNLPCPAVPNGTPTCTAGICGTTCKPGFHACAGACAADTDAQACGPTCAVCPVPPNAQATCAANACAFQCNAGHADCNANPADGCEARLADDPLHCGLCGTACAAGQACVAGVCTAPPAP